MTKSTLLWWLFTVATFASMAVAGMMGFYEILLRNDVTYLGVAVCGLYVITTAWIGFGLLRGNMPGAFAWHMVEVLERAGLLGTCAGLAIVFFSVANIDPSSPEFKIAVVHGVMTKLLASICGLVGWIYLSTQLRLLGVKA